MIDDETGEEIQCHYCGAVDPCEHLVAMIDQTFFECTAGFAADVFYQFESTILEAFHRWNEDGAAKPHPSIEGALKELWDSAPKDWDPEEVGVLERHAYFRLATELLQNAGGERHPGSVHDGEAPGFSSAINLFYAERPWAVFNRALRDLRRRLEPSPT